MARQRRRDRTEHAAIAPSPMRAVAAADKPKPETLEEYCSEIRTLLRDITSDAELVAELIDSRQRRMVDLNAEAREAQAAQASADRLAKAERRMAEEPLGWGWMRVDEAAKSHGPTALPGDVNAISIGAEIVQTLHRIAIDLTPFEVFPRLPERTGLDKVNRTARQIRVFIAAAGDEDLPRLERSYAALDRMVDRARELIDGHGQRSRLSAPCPHCGLVTLVAFWDDQIIRCDRTDRAKHFAPCICSDPLCVCHERPIGHRHIWFGPSSKVGKSPSWSALRDRLNVTRAVTTTKKK